MAQVLGSFVLIAIVCASFPPGGLFPWALCPWDHEFVSSQGLSVAPWPGLGARPSKTPLGWLGPAAPGYQQPGQAASSQVPGDVPAFSTLLSSGRHTPVFLVICLCQGADLFLSYPLIRGTAPREPWLCVRSSVASPTNVFAQRPPS